jgi:hypothetical protein
MIDQLAPLLSAAPWIALVVLASAYGSLRFRHRLAKRSLAHVREELAEARRLNWQRVVDRIAR